MLKFRDVLCEIKFLIFICTDLKVDGAISLEDLFTFSLYSFKSYIKVF